MLGPCSVLMLLFCIVSVFRLRPLTTENHLSQSVERTMPNRFMIKNFSDLAKIHNQRGWGGCDVCLLGVLSCIWLGSCPFKYGRITSTPSMLMMDLCKSETFVIIDLFSLGPDHTILILNR